MKEADTRATYELTRLMMWELKEKKGFTIAEIAEAAGLSPKTVEKYPAEGCPTLPTSIAWIRHFRPAETMKYLAKQGGGLFVMLPESDGKVSKILEGLSALGTEFSDVVASVSRAISPASEGGSEITVGEAKDLLTEVNEVIEKAVALGEALKEVVNGRDKI